MPSAGALLLAAVAVLPGPGGRAVATVADGVPELSRSAAAPDRC